MAYRFLDTDDTVQAGLRRIAREQIDNALAALDATGEARAGAVHDVRKNCKKLRGLVRIVRPSFAGYEAENAALRDIANLLGELRDAKVMLDTYDLVMADYDGSVDRAAIAPVRTALAPQRQAERAEAEIRARFAEARAKLAAARERCAAWELEDEGWEAVARGVARTYSRAVKTMHKAAKKAATHSGGETHHEWRKRVKYHWYHTRLLRQIWPDHMRQRAKLAHELAELLGHHHDCQVFEDTLTAQPATFASPAAVETVVALTRRRRALLEERAHRLGARLLADDPKALLARWGEWWQAWQGEGEGEGALRKAALER